MHITLKTDRTTIVGVMLLGAFARWGCNAAEATPPPTVALSESASAPEWTIRADGAMRMTAPPAFASDQNPAFSPDGTRLVFTRFDEGYNDGPAGLHLLDMGSGQVTRLTPFEDQDNVNLPGAAWNGANDRIVFASDRLESDDLWRIAPDGTDLSSITMHSGPPWYIEPSWSPDGRWIVFEVDLKVPDGRRQGSIWKVRADGTGLTTLTDGPGGDTDDRQPNWSPRGGRTLFQRRSSADGQWDVFTVTSSGIGLVNVTGTPTSDETDASWSPGGNCIVYSSDDGDLPAPNIFVVPAAGGQSARVTFSDSREDSAPSWSPDGQWIAFESHEAADADSSAALWRIAVPAGACDESEFQAHLPLAIASSRSAGSAVSSACVDEALADSRSTAMCLGRLRAIGPP